MKLCIIIAITLFSVAACRQTATKEKTVASEAKTSADSLTVITVDASSGKAQSGTMSIDDLKESLVKWDKMRKDNSKAGNKYFNPTTATVYWIKHHGTPARFSFFPDEWTGIYYHAMCFYGNLHEGRVYTNVDSTCGEIYFDPEHVTTNLTETNRWEESIESTFSSINEAIIVAAAIDTTIMPKAVAYIMADMKATGVLKKQKKYSSAEISNVLKMYMDLKNEKGLIYKDKKITI